MRPIALAGLLLLGVMLWHDGAAAESSSIVLASTTSVENSGLLAKILPLFTKGSGIEVRVIAQGTGQALATAARGDADLVLVHDPEAEDHFIAEGHAGERRQIAWNDFIIVGPQADPAHVAGGHDAVAGLAAIASARAPFVSRGDKSGTDALEKRLWRKAAIDPVASGGGAWYRDIGGGMGAALNAASAMAAYTLSDRGTWLSFNNKRLLVVVIDGDSALLNRYDVILLDRVKHPDAKTRGSTTACRMADLARRAGGDRRLHNSRRTAVPPVGFFAKMNTARVTSERQARKPKFDLRHYPSAE